MLLYSTTELVANRGGKMTLMQQERLREQLLNGQRNVADDVTHFGFVLGGLIVVSYIAGLSTMLTMTLLATAILAFGLFKYLETGMLRRLADDVEHGMVGHIHGVVRLQQQQRGNTTIYRLEMPTHRYRTRIEARVYRTLHDGMTYRLYIAASSGTLLSLEPWTN